VGPSDDGTDQVAAAIAANERRVHVIPNPSGVTPTGLNAAIAATRGEVVVRVDGHSSLSVGYIRRAVATMARTGAVNVGGMQVPTARTPFEEAVAAATTSWIGTGGATYRVGGAEGPVDTVYLGVFDRAAGDQVGWFDGDLIRNQDYELNIRLRRAGGQVWFDPELSVGYRPRGSWTALARQYYDYGYWKARVLRRHPGSTKLRQVLPAALPAALLVPLVRSRGPSRFVGVTAYLLAVSSIGRLDARRVAVTVVVHFSWCAGLTVGLVRPTRASERWRVRPISRHASDSAAE
jgi:hypothetical protein